MATKRANRLSYIEETPKHFPKLRRVVKRGVKVSIERSQGRGLYITYKRGNEIIREFPDGCIEVIGLLDSQPRRVKVGSKSHLTLKVVKM